MTSKKTTRRALFMSIISLLLCCSMLVGTTFAWFTDEVVSGKNQILAGNLDVELYVGNEPIDPSKNYFTTDLWEPGHVEVLNMKIANVGSLALKYQFQVKANEEISGTNQAGEAFNLSDHIKYALIPTAFAGNRAEAVAEAEKHNPQLISALTQTESGQLLPAKEGKPGESKDVTLVVWMPETVDNTANHKTGTTAPSITMGINLFATQLENESDSFGSDYDAGAGWLGDTAAVPEADAAGVITITNAEQLAGLAAAVNGGNSYQGKTIKLGADINLGNQPWTPIGNANHGFSATFDGDGYTVYNLNVEAEINAGLFGYALNGGNFKNLTVKNATVKANDYAGAILGRGYTDIDNCRAENVTVITTPYQKADGTYDGGAKAGGIVGQMLEGSGNTVTNCSVTNAKIYAFRDLGGVVGMVHNNNSASGNTATNVTLGYILFDKITADKNENAGAVYGRVQSSATVSPAQNSTENQNFTQVYVVYDAITLTALANKVNSGESFKGKTVVMLNDINLGNVNWTPIGKTFNQYEFGGTFDGQGHTVSNFTVDNGSGSALFGFVRGGSPVIKNVTVKNVTATGHDYVGGVVGQLYGVIENCHAVNVNVTATPFQMTSGNYDGGAKAGGVVGWMESGAIYKASNCTANGCTIKAFRDLGGVIGMAHNNNIITDCKAYNSTLSYVTMPAGTVMDGGKVNENIGEVIGRRGTNVVETGTYFENVTLHKVKAYTSGTLFDAIHGLSAGDTLVIPGGTYNTSGSFQVPAGVTIAGAEGETVVFHQTSAAQDNLFNCAGDVTFRNVTFESNYKGYAITDITKNHDTDGNITVIDCHFKGIATGKNWGIYKNLNGNLTVKDCTFDNYNNALCGINNGNGSTTTITGCTFTNINAEAIGYVTSSMPADFETTVIANNTGLTAENVIGY